MDNFIGLHDRTKWYDEDTLQDLKLIPIKFAEIYYNSKKEISEDDILYLKYARKILFNDDFNKSIDDLPDNIINIELGNKFYQTINKIPKQLKYLKMKTFDNNIIKNKKVIKNSKLNTLEVEIFDIHDNNNTSKINFGNILTNSIERLIINDFNYGMRVILFTNFTSNIKELKLYYNMGFNKKKIILRKDKK